MVGERGFEPPTPWSRTRCSTRLSHSPTCCVDAKLRVPPAAFVPLIRSNKFSRSVAALRERAGRSYGADFGWASNASLLPLRVPPPRFSVKNEAGPRLDQESSGYFLSSAGGGAAPGKIPSRGTLRFCSVTGSGSGFRGNIWSLWAAL